jgi:uncharacterized coiled-coil protein SlyX
MGTRLLAALSLASVTLAAALGLFLMRAEAKLSPASAHARAMPSSLQAQVAAQGKLIKQLQAQVAALQRASTSKTTQMHVASGRVQTRKLPNVTHKLKLKDLSPGLKSLTAHHAQFIKLPRIYPIPLPSRPPTALQQLAAQVAQLSTQVTQLNSQVSSLKTELGFDENLFGEEFLLVQNNLTSVANSVPVLPAGQGFCGGNGGMSWGGLKYHINDNLMDNDFFCYLVQ